MIRRATQADSAAIQRIQESSPETAQWVPEGYPALVAEVEGSLRGFVSWLELPTGEIEILNLAVDPAFRRRGLATELLRGLIACRPAAIYLEVRQSNSAARELYKSLGFKNLSIRAAYYHHPAEAAVVMKWSS